MANPLKMLKLKPEGFQFILEVPIDAPPAKVWKAIFNVRGWFYFPNMLADHAMMRIEEKIGGMFTSSSDDGTQSQLHGTVTRIDRNKLLRIQGAMGMTHLPAQNAMIWELQPKKDGKATLLRFCHRGYGYVTADIKKNFKGGWKTLLPQLKKLAEKKK